MKRILSFIALIFIIVGTTCCSDYLDIKPRGTDTPNKLSHFEGLLYGHEVYGSWMYQYGSFEHTIDAAGFSSLYAIEGHNASKAFQWQADIYRPDDQSSEWNVPCTLFYTFNVVVNNVMDAGDGTETQKSAVRAEARFMRAWYTFMMAQYFGKPYDQATSVSDLCIPIITTASTADQDFSRRTVKEVYEYILKEMTESLPYLTKLPAHSKRIFHATGNAMLGKVYWMMGKYHEALPYLAAAKLILDTDKNKVLINFEGKINKTTGNISGYPNLSVSTEVLYEVASMPNMWSAYAPMLLGEPLRTFRPDVFHKYFSSNDCRLGLFSGAETGMTAYANFSQQVRYYTNTTSMYVTEGISLPDVYLMYAECLAREGDLEKAKQVLYELRINRMPVAQASVPVTVTTKDDLVKFAVAERIRENFGTGLLWYDMRRLWNDPLFQDLKQYYTRTDGTTTYTLTKERLTMQIPPSVMVWHPEYVQND